MRKQIALPTEDGRLMRYTLREPGHFPEFCSPPRSRNVYAAAHLVSREHAYPDQSLIEQIDWDATIAYRRYLWSLGFSVAEAMDTAQRGMGLDWETVRELIHRSAMIASEIGVLDRLACGAGTDQLPISATTTLEEISAAYEEQCTFIESQGVRIILMASRVLAALARSPEDYIRVYDRVLSQVRQPVILHWLGAMFDPTLVGYWSCGELDEAMTICLDLIRRHSAKIDGIKLSLLSAEREVRMRRCLPAGVKMYTGDDFNYVELIRGDEQGYSHALLGIFDAIAPVAAAALQALDQGDISTYETLLAPTIPLSRHIFQAPTYYYKTGLVFLAYLNGHQQHFCMVGGLENARSLPHLVQLFLLADQAGLLREPEQAMQRMQWILEAQGSNYDIHNS